MPDKTDIVQRLRTKQELANSNARYGVLPDDLYGKAADLIEQQAATIRALRERVEKLEMVDLNPSRTSTMSDGNGLPGDLVVENCISSPKIVERRCGGWLAVSGASEPVKVGVTAETKADAIELFNSTIRAWRLALSERV